MHRCPEIFNTDQGSQFTAEAFTDALRSKGISISMDGTGRWMATSVCSMWNNDIHRDITH
jgi:putative transposase